MKYLRIRQRREQLRFTVFHCAGTVKVAPLTWRMWERGLSEPQEENKRKVERLLGRRWKWLAQEAAA